MEQLPVAVPYFDAVLIVDYIDVSSARHTFKNGSCFLYDNRQALILDRFDVGFNQYAYIVQGHILAGESLNLIFAHFKHMIEITELSVAFKTSVFRVEFRKYLLLMLNLVVELLYLRRNILFFLFQYGKHEAGQFISRIIVEMFFIKLRGQFFELCDIDLIFF